MSRVLGNTKSVNEIAKKFIKGEIEAKIVRNKLQICSSSSVYRIEPVPIKYEEGTGILLQFRKPSEKTGYVFHDTYGIAYNYNYKLELLSVTLSGKIIECEMNSSRNIAYNMNIFTIHTYD